MSAVDLVAGARPSLRAVRDDDRRFLRELYGATRAAELALVAWDDAAKAAFVEQQFNAQDTHYRTHYEDASFDIVEVGGQAAGRLYVQRGERDIRVIDILLAPAFRGRGIGGLLLGELVAEAQAGGRVLSLHVEPGNPARRLYERLGFRAVAEHGLYVLMELEAPAQDQVKTAS